MSAGWSLSPPRVSVAFYSTIGVRVEPQDYCSHLSAPPNVLVTMSGARAPIPVGVVLLVYGIKFRWIKPSGEQPPGSRASEDMSNGLKVNSFPDAM